MKSLKSHLFLILGLVSIFFSIEVYTIIDKVVKKYEKQIVNHYTILVVSEKPLSIDDFKDIKERILKLKKAGETVIFGPAMRRKESTLVFEGGLEMPRLGRYEIVEELGRGAMGVVYKGRDPKINRFVSIKTVSFEEVEPEVYEEVKKRFFRRWLPGHISCRADTPPC